jgi:hypothetical protein
MSDALAKKRMIISSIPLLTGSAVFLVFFGALFFWGYRCWQAVGLIEGLGHCGDREPWAVVLLTTPVWLALIGLILAWRRGLHDWLVRTVYLLSISLTMLLLFSAPPSTLVPGLQKYAARPSAVAKSLPGESTMYPNPRELILVEEHKKAVDEIKLRIEHEDSWFRYKFLLIGGLLLALLTRLGFGPHSGSDDNSSAKPESAQASPHMQMKKLLTSNVTCCALALSCVVAVTIDIHIRSNFNVTNQIGLWLAYYSEPAFLEGAEKTRDAPFYPWEQFLRIPPSEKVGALMHRSDLYSLTFWPHLHFLTWVIYMLYLNVLYTVCLQVRHSTDWPVIGSFTLLQASIAVFAWVAHSAPEAVALQPIPFLDCWLSGWSVPLMYLFLALFLASINLPYLALARVSPAGR